MKKLASPTASPRGMFSGNDFRMAGGGRTSVPGTGWLDRRPVPPPTPPPVPTAPPPRPPQQTTQAPQQPPSPYSGFDPRNPQGFAQWAGMLRPITQAVGQFGGMPALMGIYGMLSGSKDWSKAFQKQPSTTSAADSRLLQMPQIKTSSNKLPLPVMTLRGLGMPLLHKTADALSDWESSFTPKADLQVNDELAPPRAAPLSSYNDPYSAYDENLMAPQKEAPQQHIDGTPAGPNWRQLGKAVGTNIGAYAGTRGAIDLGMRRFAGQGLGATQKATAAQLAAKGLPRLATKATPFLGADTLVNAGTDLLDAAGIYSMDGSKEFSVWQKPRLDGQGNIIRNEDGTPLWDRGFNPNALGWNMDEFNKGTTPDGNIAFGYRTGNDTLDDVGSYATSSLRAYSNPLKSLGSLAKYQYWDVNPLAQIAFNPEEREGWRRIMGGRNLLGQKGSIPLTATNHLIGAQPWRANKDFREGGKLFGQEAAIHRSRDTYHPVYNREGSKNRPGRLGRWWDMIWH